MIIVTITIMSREPPAPARPVTILAYCPKRRSAAA